MGHLINPYTLSANIDLDSEGAAAGNFQISTVILGDLNRDTVVDLLDASPFVDRIANNEFQGRALGPPIWGGQVGPLPTADSMATDMMQTKLVM